MENRRYKGLQNALREMPQFNRHNGLYVEVHYDFDNDEVLAKVHCSLGGNNWTEYANPRIVRIGFFFQRVSAKKLKAYIDEAISWAFRVSA